MSQHDFTIANQSFPATRSDLNLALQALASTNKGAAPPSTLFTGELWIDDSPAPWTLNCYDGAGHIALLKIHPTTDSVTLDSLDDGSVGTPCLAHKGDVNTGIFFPAADMVAITTGGAERLRVDAGKLFLKETANGNMTTGLTINQGAADNEIIALKSSDVAHGVTAETETDTYGLFGKAVAAVGGLSMEGFSESEIALALEGTATSEDTGSAGSSNAVIQLNAQKKSGTGRAALTAGGNLLCIRNGAGNTRWIVKGNGDTYRDGTDNTFDDYEDAELLRVFDREMAPDKVIRSEFDDFLRYNRDDLVRAGIVSSDKDSNFYNESQLTRLLTGCAWQTHVKIERALARLTAVEATLTALPQPRA